MGKSFPNNKTRIKQLGETASQFLNSRTPKQAKPTPQTRASVELQLKDKNLKRMEGVESSVSNSSISSDAMRVPLSEVVSDCVKRWFKDTLKEAKAGDISMQVLVGQMYFSGYGVARDAQKGRIWISRASRIRSSVWKIGEKHPGYNASDSDSEEMKEGS